MSVIIASIIISVVGYFTLSEIHVAGLMCSLVVISELVLALVKKLVHRQPEAKAHLINAAGVLIVLAFTVSIAVVDRRAMHKRAEIVVAAIEKFETDKKALPDTLKELVPAYLAEIPHAKHTLLWGAFIYRKEAGKLYWVATPAFLTLQYDLKTKEWGVRSPLL